MGARSAKREARSAKREARSAHAASDVSALGAEISTTESLGTVAALFFSNSAQLDDNDASPLGQHVYLSELWGLPTLHNPSKTACK